MTLAEALAVSAEGRADPPLYREACFVLARAYRQAQKDANDEAREMHRAIAEAFVEGECSARDDYHAGCY